MTNVISIEKPQPETKSARFTITCELDGFAVTVEAEGRADNLKALIDRLKAIGAHPPQTKAVPRTTTPMCPIHNKAMKPSRKPGAFFCPARTQDGDYCTEKA